MTRSHWKGLLSALFASLAMLAAGCDDDEGGTVPPPIATPPDDNQVPRSTLRLVHASPDAPAVDVYIQGQQEPLITQLTYGTATGDLPIPYGSQVLEFRPAGTAATSPPVFSTDPIDFIPAERVTAVAAGLLNARSEDNSFRVLALAEGTGEPTPNTASVRIVHAGADAPTVGIDVGNDGSVEVADLDRFADTGRTAVALPPGISLQVGIVSETGEKVTAFTLPTLSAGTEVILVATGLLSAAPHQPEGFALLAVGREGSIGFVLQNPVVYALHASPDAPAVDIFSAGTEVADDLTFGELSSPIQVPPGTYALDFFSHQAGREQPAGDPAAQGNTPMLTAGQRYLVVASGFLGRTGEARRFSLLSYAESFAEAGEQVRLRLVHAVPDAPAVDVGPLDNQGLLPEESVTFQDLAYSQASAPEGVALPASPIAAGVTAANAAEREPLLSFSIDLSPLQGNSLFLVAAGALSPQEGEQRFQLVLVNTTSTPWSTQSVAPR
ncbi:MAG: DUF4397 domain-containing protein [Myxococcaceae bacterium]|nr:DUF4397 domain-containing protein [Myxococcaceae bacterium]